MDSAPEPAGEEVTDVALDAAATPYRNLWVPLVVVPFLVVGVIVIVYVFFGAIAGRTASMTENLHRMLDGGPNERQQAAAGFAEQIVTNLEARSRGEPAPNEYGSEFARELEQAWTRLEEEGNQRLKLVVARAMTLEGLTGTRARLESFLAMPDGEDPDGQLRFNALDALGQLADPAAAPAVIPFLEHEDRLLRQGAAMALQTLPGPETFAALEGLLGASSLELRGMSAVSLARLGRESGAELLRDMTGQEIYAAARREEPRKFAADVIQHNRATAVRALGRLGRPADRSLVEDLASGEPDPIVREAAMRALAEWGAPGPDSPESGGAGGG